MKNDKLIYVLLPAVAIIWLIIGYQFYQAVEPKEIASLSQTAITIPVEEKNSEIYQLQLDYPDPFLKRQQQKVTVVTLPVRQTAISSLSIAPTITTSSKDIDWEAITYHGMIENNQTTDRVGILALDGVRKLVKEGSHVGAFTVERILKDSVMVKGGEKARYIIKQGKIQWLSKKP